MPHFKMYFKPRWNNINIDETLTMKTGSDHISETGSGSNLILRIGSGFDKNTRIRPDTDPQASLKLEVRSRTDYLDPTIIGKYVS